MRIATFNVEHLGLPHGDVAPSLEARIEALRPMLQRLHADVLCLQEVDGDKVRGEPGRKLLALDAVLEGTRYAGYERHISGQAAAHPLADVHNLVTLSRLPIVDRRELQHAFVPPMEYAAINGARSAEPKAQITFDRPALHTTLALADGRSLHVFNIHLRAPIASPVAGQKVSAGVWKTTAGWAEGFFRSGWKRSAQALDIRLAIDALLDADRHALIAVAGDCNSEDHETPLKILTAADEDTGNGDLAWRGMVNVTRSVPADRRFSIIHHGRPQMVDHILLSRSLMGGLCSVGVHNEALGDELVGYGRIRRFPGSFHAPVVTELEIG